MYSNEKKNCYFTARFTANSCRQPGVVFPICDCHLAISHQVFCKRAFDTKTTEYIELLLNDVSLSIIMDVLSIKSIKFQFKQNIILSFKN